MSIPAQHTERTQLRDNSATSHHQEGQELEVQSLAPPALQLAASPTLPTGGAENSGANGFSNQATEKAAPFQLQAENPTAPLNQAQPFQLQSAPEPVAPSPVPVPYPNINMGGGAEEKAPEQKTQPFTPSASPSGFPTLPQAPVPNTNAPAGPAEEEDEAAEDSAGAEPAQTEAAPEAPSDSGGASDGPAGDAEGGSGEESAETQPEEAAEEDAGGGGAGGSAGGALGGEDTPASAEEDPNFQQAKGSTKATGEAQKSHLPANQEASAAQNAAVSPASEVESQAQNNQMGEMQAAETPAFDKAAFKAKLMEKIKAAAPKTLKEADDFKSNNKLGQVKGEMGGMVAGEKESSQGPLEEKTKAAPDTGAVTPRTTTPLPPPEVGAQPTTVGGANAVPPPRTPAQVEAPVQQGSQSLDDEMAQEEVTEEQLQHSNEPQFQQALDAKKGAQKDAKESPPKARQEEQAQIVAGKQEAQALEVSGLADMHGSRTQAMTQLGGDQQETKSKDEQERERIATAIDGIYQTAKTDVEKILTELDDKVDKAFDSGSKAAQKAFEDHVARRMGAYKRRRYSGLVGAGRWVKDKLLGMPSEVNAFYEEGRNLYLARMDGVIDNVVNIIGAELTRAKARIAQGKAEVSEYVAQLPQDLQKVGQEAATNIQSKFDSLESEVDSKQDALIDSLATKYNERLQAIDSRIEEMKAANAGLVDKALGAIKAVIETIKKLKDMISNVLKKAGGVLKAIISDPIGFLGNLIKGIGQGLKQFGSNILKHLKAGFIGWLTGAIGGMGLQIPDDVFSLKGMFSLVLQILGISWAWVRQKAVKLFGEPVVKMMEGAVEVFKFIMNKDWAGLWEYIKGKFNDLKSMVIDAIQDLLIDQVLKAGIKWIMGLLNPAGAFVKACMLIYDIVMFFVNQGSRIMSLVTAVLDGIGAVASGNIGLIANKIEDALSKAVPVAIGFMASLLGIGGLAEKVQKIIGSVRAKFNKAIDWMLNGLKKMAKGLFKKLKGGDKKKAKEEQEKGPDERSAEEKQKDLNSAMKIMRAKADAGLSLEKLKKEAATQKDQYRLKSLTITPEKDGKYKFEGEVNPRESFLIEIDQDEKEPPTDAVAPVKMGYATSHSGNRRLYCYDSEGGRWVWSEGKSFWQRISDQKKLLEAEKAANSWLSDNKETFTDLVSVDKPLEEGGFDNFGLQADEEGNDTLIIGDTKGAFGANPQYFSYQGINSERDNPFSATTGNLGQNLTAKNEELADQPDLIDRISTALQNGNVEVIYFWQVKQGFRVNN